MWETMVLVNSKEWIHKKILGETPTSYSFVLMFLTYFVFVSANESLIPTLPIFLSRLGINERDIGVLLGVFAISSMISRFFVGKVLIRYSEKSVTESKRLSIDRSLSLFYCTPLFLVHSYDEDHSGDCIRILSYNGFYI